MATRKSIPPKIRLQVLKRDNFTCQSCGKSPASYPELEIDAVPKLEIDHFQPHSKGGSDDLENLQTLCFLCNRGKGNSEYLNHTIEEKIDNLLDVINPQIRGDIKKHGVVPVVANDSDFRELQRLNSLIDAYGINILNGSISGYQAAYSRGIYTVQDNHAGKVNFEIKRETET